MRTRYHLTEHAAYETIPLRIGVVPSGRKVYLERIVQDDKGTADQRASDIERGHCHILADIWTALDGGICYGRWRIVTVQHVPEGRDKPVFTVLPVERELARTAANLTDFLRKEREKTGNEWLTPDYIAETLYPLVKVGTISNHSDLATHILKKLEFDWSEKTDFVAHERNVAKEAASVAAAERDQARRMAEQAIAEAQQAKTRAEHAEQSQQETFREVQMLRAALNAQAASPLGMPPLKGQHEQERLRAPATAVTEKWRSRTTNSRYLNIGIEAFIEDVTCHQNRICLRFVDSKGMVKEIQDFGILNGFVAPVFDYLVSRKGQRAVFLVTNLPDGPLKLASDTMMLESYRELWSSSSGQEGMN